MNDSPESTQYGNSLQQDLDKLVACIARIPASVLTQRLASHHGVECSVRDLAAQAVQSCWVLLDLVRIGDRDAIKALKEMGNWIGKVLVQLQTIPSEGASVFGRSGRCLSPEETIANDTAIKATIDRLKRHDLVDLVAAKNRLDPKFSAPITPIPVVYGVSLPWQGPYALGDDTSEAVVLDSVVNHYLSLCLQWRRAANVEAEARSSFFWPIVAEAVEDQRPNRTEGQIQRLRLGEELPIRVARQRKQGGTRSFDPASQTGFALEVFSQLYSVQKEFPGLGEKVSDWVLLARRLPPFAPDKVLPEWLDAGMALLCERCEGKWERFGKSLPSVEGRAGWRARSSRKHNWERAVRDILEAGLFSLLRHPPAKTRRKQKLEASPAQKDDDRPISPPD